ncbi:MAG: AAA family ATPase [Planctomycetes bacterium]|nr:AAA family ATPase [Planctomycetota bacterium]
MPIAALRFTNLGPFEEVDFDFDQQINVLVGPNNCGKTTSLLALANLAVRRFQLPPKLLRQHPSAFHTSFFDGDRKQRPLEGIFPVAYSADDPASPWFTAADILGVSKGDKWPYAKFKEFDDSRKCLGYTSFVPALRWSTDYRSEGPMRKPGTASKDSEVATRAEWSEKEERALRDETHTRASLVRDDQIVQQIVELDYRSYRLQKPVMREILNDIARLASKITEGYPIAFSGIAEDDRGLFLEFETPDGKMPLDVLSQGTQSLIQWLAQLFIGYAKHYRFPRSLNRKPGILIIDEIDAHLHPSWQRKILPALARQFPGLQVFCSTHSPLMLAGLKAGQIQLLTRDPNGKITVSRNESDIIGWSADEILTSFLGVDNATDLDSEEILQRLQELRGKKRLTAKQRKELESLRNTMNQRLLAGPASEELAQFTHGMNRPGNNSRKESAQKETRSRKTAPASRTSKSTRKSTKAKK